MTIKCTPKLIQAGGDRINYLLQADIPALAADRVSRLAEACQKELERFSGVRQKLFEKAGCTIETVKVTDQKTGEQVDQGQWAHADPVAFEAVKLEAAELEDGELELAVLPLDIAHFKDAILKGNAFVGLGWAMKPA